MLKLNPSIHRCHCLSRVRPCQHEQGGQTAGLSQTLPFFFTRSGSKSNNTHGNCMTQHGKERQENSCSSHSRTIWRAIHLGTDGARHSRGWTWTPHNRRDIFLYESPTRNSWCFACPTSGLERSKQRSEVKLTVKRLRAWYSITEQLSSKSSSTLKASSWD